MEPQKRARYSKHLDAEELEEILMEDESDEELEIESQENMSSSSSSDNEPEETKDVAVFVLKIKSVEARSTAVKSVTLRYVWWIALRSGTLA
jgi:hypothetical protein